MQQGETWRAAAERRLDTADRDRTDPAAAGGGRPGLAGPAERAGASRSLTVAIRPPTVPEGRARLRLVLHRTLPDETLDTLIQVWLAPAVLDETGHRHAWLERRRGSWHAWERHFSRHGWSWCSGERGYGDRTPVMPTWRTTEPTGTKPCRAVIAHSGPPSHWGRCAD